MKYEDYIRYGFRRTDFKDNVELNKTGYYGFSLELKLAAKTSIIVNSGELNKAKLYIKKGKGPYCRITNLSIEQVHELLQE
jgi:hypothetical protein